MPSKYDWSSFNNPIYQRYIMEASTLEETRIILANDFQFILR